MAASAGRRPVYAPPARAAGARFADLVARSALRLQQGVTSLAQAARGAPGEVAASAGRLRAGAETVARAYSRDEREALALLFLPFLLVASAIVVHQSVRTLQSYLTAIAVPDEEIAPLAPAVPRDVRLAAVPRLEARETLPPRIDLAAVRGAPEPRSVAGPGPSLAEAALPAGAGALAAPDLEPPLRPGWTVIAPSGDAESPPARADTALALLAPLEETGSGVRPLAPAPIAALEVDDEGNPVRPGICAIDQVPRTPAPTALTLGETLRPVDAETFGLRLAKAAESQVGALVIYNDAYRSISYPMGDVHRLYGVCTDVVVRAYRDLGLDLQALVHEARSGAGDTSIDHRRTEILRRFFSTHGESLPITTFPEDYRPGDIVTYYRPQNRRTRAHIAVVSSVMAPSGRPMIVHNRGWGPALEDALFVDQITGHYRYRGPVQTRNAEEGSGAVRPWARDLSAPLLPAAYASGHVLPAPQH